jgi:hypothetical protein
MTGLSIFPRTSSRFSLVQDCAKLKTSYARPCVSLFPELENIKPTPDLRDHNEADAGNLKSMAG